MPYESEEQKQRMMKPITVNYTKPVMRLDCTTDELTDDITSLLYDLRGSPFEIVQEKIKELLNSKMVVKCAGTLGIKET